MSVSVVIPAHNEEQFIHTCMQAIAVAAEQIDAPVETIVVLNRCTDQTEQLARGFGATCIADASRCLATVRNTGVANATGEVIVTCDADSRLHPDTLSAALAELSNGAIGGGLGVLFDRRSPGIAATEFLFRLIVRSTGLSCGAFWTTRKAFDAVGGFNETIPMGEDFDFAKRLKAFGRTTGQPYRTLWTAPLTSSARKFDKFGDWSFFKMMLVDAGRIRRSIKGHDTDFVDEYFYDFNDS